MFTELTDSQKYSGLIYGWLSGELKRQRVRKYKLHVSTTCVTLEIPSYPLLIVEYHIRGILREHCIELIQKHLIKK